MGKSPISFTPRAFTYALNAVHWVSNQYCTAVWKATSSASTARQCSSADASWRRRASSGQRYQGASWKWVLAA